MPSSPNPNLKKGRGIGPIDAALGLSVRSQRLALGLTQKHFGNAIGVTTQQVLNYESGSNKLSVSQLIEIAQVLDCRVGDLVGGLDKLAERRPVNISLDLTGASKLLAAYSGLPNPLRQATLELFIEIEKIQTGKRPRRKSRSSVR